MRKEVSYMRATYKMVRGSGYGQYQITKTTKNKTKTIHSTDSQIFDWMDDDSDQEKQKEALQSLRRLFRN